MLAAVASSILALSGDALSSEVDAEHIFGGAPASECDWPSVVALSNGCSGVLVHPRVVVYAAHCGTDVDAVMFGESAESPAFTVRPDRCVGVPNAMVGRGNDIAICMLAERVEIPVIPPLVGCDAAVLQEGRDVVLAGFGLTEQGLSLQKHFVESTIEAFTRRNEVLLGGDGKDACAGDSGSPAFIAVPGVAGEAEWRVLGIASYGGACGEGGYYVLLSSHLSWIEATLDVDVTPCHTAGGVWEPGPDCGGFPMVGVMGDTDWSDDCSVSLSGPGQSCGPAHAEGDNMTPEDSVDGGAGGCSMLERERWGGALFLTHVLVQWRRRRRGVATPRC